MLPARAETVLLPFRKVLCLGKRERFALRRVPGKGSDGFGTTGVEREKKRQYRKQEA
jgi:hypothetical protein